MSSTGLGARLAGRKIVILVGVFGRGGCERQAFLLARELRQRCRLEAEVWALTEWGDYAREFEAAGIPIRCLHFVFPRCPVPVIRHLYWIARLWRVVRALRRARAAVLLPLTTYPNVVAGLVHRLAGVRVCIWGERHAGGERVPGIETIALKQYRGFAANSTAGVEFLAGEMGVPRELISFVPNGVEERRMQGANNWKQRLGLESGELLVVSVANLTKHKDHATLLTAWRAVQETWKGDGRPVLALAGAFGNAYQECQRFVHEAALERVVRFLGSISDVPALLEACDLAVFSSRNEGMPNGVLECMAAGKAVIASDLPGVRDIMGPCGADTIVPPGDTRAFTEKILWLLCDSEKRESLGEANRARIRREFSVERMVECHLKVIESNFAGSRWRKRRSRPERYPEVA